MSHIVKLRIRFHVSSLAAVVLIVAIVVTQFPEVFSLWQRILFGLVAALSFFAAVAARELILLVLALSRRIPVGNLTLFVYGAVHQEPAEVTLPILERLLAVAGMVGNLLIAALLYTLSVVAVIVGNEIAAGVTQWLAYIFFLLALVHFIPGWPLDAGRLLVAYLWQAVGSYYRAIRISSWVGSAAGISFVIGGVAVIVAGLEWSSGLLMVLVGWALLGGASLGRRQAAFHDALDGFSAGQIATVEGRPITSRLSLSEVVRNHVLVSGQRYFLVVDDGMLQGVLTLRMIRSVPKKRWESTSVRRAMVPAVRIATARGEQSANSLLQQMEGLGLREMPVLEEDGTIRVVARETVIRLAENRRHLKA